MDRKVFNDPDSTKIRQKLRSNMPEPELVLWRHIRSNQLGAKFRRQHGIGCYIVDFYCPQKKLVIEVDGESHFVGHAPEKDKQRDAFMLSLGLKVMRFTNRQVIEETESVLNAISAEI